ncbi:helix-turn-helix domain-containing protein [Amycolatopsis nigrescens]|uniref:helix-turn-helix domain-containing protein n=1 Tax=Amycolatopsis nigrescens TaxID=381445 RepID=UPI00035CAF1D|nr:helix-turn-helix transcriptional regulator [Amycolatopsis nigrescens]
MEDREPTIRSRMLGDGLRATLHAAGLSAREAARRLEWQDSTVSRLLNGKRGGDPIEVATFTGLCKTPRAERERLLGLCEDRTKPDWTSRYDAPFPQGLQVYTDHEQETVGIKCFQTVIIPGLLQTEAYFRALVAGAATVRSEEIEDRLRLRLGRQKLLEQRRSITFILHEAALRLAVGGAETMSAQMHHLLRMSVRPHVSIRVVPDTLGAHAGTAGSFTLMEFTEFKPIAYVEPETRGLLLEEPKEVASYQRVFNSLSTIALDERESRDTIARLAIDLYSSGEANDDRLQRFDHLA